MINNTDIGDSSGGGTSEGGGTDETPEQKSRRRNRVYVPSWREIIVRKLEKLKLRDTADPVDESVILKIQQRFLIFLRVWLREIDHLFDKWCKWQERYYFGGVLGLPEGIRYLKGMAVLQKSVLKEFFNPIVEKTAVAYQAEWGVETHVIDLFAAGLKMDFAGMEENAQKLLEIAGPKKIDMDAAATPPADNKALPLSTTTLSTKYAFVSVIFDNPDVGVYINALRTLARSVYRIHDGKYRFLIITPEELSSETEARLCREPSYNLEVLRVSKKMVMAPIMEDEGNISNASDSEWTPNFGGQDESYEWWRERGTLPTAVGFYRWNLVEFERLIFLDADTLVLGRLDHLFGITQPLAVGITPFASFRVSSADLQPYLNIGVMLLAPDATLYKKLMHALVSRELDDSRFAPIFEKGLQQPWLDHFFFKNQVRLGFTRFDRGDRGVGGAEQLEKQQYLGCNENFEVRFGFGNRGETGRIIPWDTVMVLENWKDKWKDKGKNKAKALDRDVILQSSILYLSHPTFPANITPAEERKFLPDPNWTLVRHHCLLPMEYNFFVEYKTATEVVDMVMNDWHQNEEVYDLEKTSRQFYRNDFGKFYNDTVANITKFLQYDLSMELPPRVLHWAGENRKPWERLHPFVRTKFDLLWWAENKAMKQETKVDIL